MDLFKLVGTIAIENSEANKAIEGTTEKAEKSHSKMEIAFQKMGNLALKAGKVVAVGIGAGATAIGVLSKKAMDEYANYEQLAGGVETLFKGSSSKVLEYANQAYKTAGMSANQYMETVTGFSASLLQSLNGDTEKASEKANQAIVDMSDNANKMGTSMEAIQNAYQGFAKQNYTMLDNLKLGYGGTKEEMQRLLSDAEKISGIKYDISSYADVVDAIHVMQESMGIAGTTSKEASTTIQGSIGMMSSAWSNFLTGMADPAQDFDALLGNLVDSVVTVANNIVPRIVAMLPRLVEGVTSLISQLANYIPDILGKLLPALIQGAVGLINQIVTILPDLIAIIIDQLPLILDGIMQIFVGIVQALPSLITTITQALPEMIMIVVQTLVSNLPALIQGIVQLIVGITQALPEIIVALINELPQIISLIVQALIENIPILIQGAVQMVAGLVMAIPQIISALIQAIPQIITSIVTGFAPMLEKMKQVATNVMNAVKEVFVNIWNAIKNAISNIMEAIKTFISNVWNGIKTTVSNVVNGIKTTVSNVFNAIKTTISNILNGVKTTFSNVWNGIKTTVTNVINGIKTGISNGLNGAKNVVTNVLNGIKNSFSNIFENVKNVVKGAIDKIKGFFQFKVELPKIKLPHFGISPSGWQIGDLLKGSIPKLGIEWYAKAMDKGMIMNQPTIFGYDSASQNFLAGGEAGSETVVGTQNLMDMIQTSVDSRMNVVVQAILNLQERILESLGLIYENMGYDLVLDTGALVAETAPQMDEELGKIFKRKGRQ